MKIGYTIDSVSNLLKFWKTISFFLRRFIYYIYRAIQHTILCKTWNQFKFQFTVQLHYFQVSLITSKQTINLCTVTKIVKTIFSLLLVATQQCIVFFVKTGVPFLRSSRHTERLNIPTTFSYLHHTVAVLPRRDYPVTYARPSRCVDASTPFIDCGMLNVATHPTYAQSTLSCHCFLFLLLTLTGQFYHYQTIRWVYLYHKNCGKHSTRGFTTKESERTFQELRGVKLLRGSMLNIWSTDLERFTVQKYKSKKPNKENNLTEKIYVSMTNIRRTRSVIEEEGNMFPTMN